MTHVTASWVEREGRELHRIESLEPVRSYAAMQAEPACQAACAVLSEITAAIVHDEQPEHATFRLLGAVLAALEGGLHPWLAVRYAEYWTLKLHGVLPDLAHCAVCGEPFPDRSARWAVGGVGFLCRRCPKPQGAVSFRGADLAAVASIDKHPPHALEIPLDVARPLGALETLLRGTVEAFAERTFRSYRHLRAATAAGA